MNETQTANCISLHAAAEFVSQLTLHFFSDNLHISNKHCFLIGLIGTSMARLLLIEINHVYLVFVVSILLGYFKAFISVHYMLVISEYCSVKCPEKLAKAVSLNMIITGIFTLTFGHLLGFIRDLVNDYAVCFHVENLFLLIVLIVWVLFK